MEPKETKSEKRAREKQERQDEEEERERKRQAREAARRSEPNWPVVEFCEKLGDFPWNNRANNWGFKEGTPEFKLLTTKVAAPNDTIRKVSGHATFSGYENSDVEASEVDLPSDFTYNDVAQAIKDVALGQGSGGMICQVLKCNLSKDDPTVLCVKLDIYAFQEDWCSSSPV
ncbi:hypothetical protein ACHAWF_007614 [Thalassiosira exigua]